MIDLADLMQQAGVWPFVTSLGAESQWRGPAPADGVRLTECKSGTAAMDVVLAMHAALGRFDGRSLASMPHAEYWHPDFMWYGAAGIGTTRGLEEFRAHHQIPFLNAMPDRGQYVEDITYHFFGDGAYCGVTGWPNMIQTLTGDGWMGIAPAGKRFTMKSLDFWRMEDGLIRENWVMVDLLDAYDQLGVDVLGRMAEFNKTRVSGRLPFPVGVP